MRQVATIAVLASIVALSACNTVAGAGKDVSSAGTALSNAAAPVK